MIRKFLIMSALLFSVGVSQSMFAAASDEGPVGEVFPGFYSMNVEGPVGSVFPG